MSVLDCRRVLEQWSGRCIRGAILGLLVFAAGMLGILVFKAVPVLRDVSAASLFLATAWHPWKGMFGLLPFIAASLGVTLIALAMAAPISLLGALYLSESAGRRVRNLLRVPIDLLAGVPSVVFGLFGVIVIVPAVAALGRLFGAETTGYSMLAGGILLAIMVVPFILSVSLEMLLSVPAEAREAAYALGATRWETIRHVVLKRARMGLVAAVILGFSRAFGETIAVMMVVGNVARVPHSLFDPAYPLPALIANNYGELLSIPMFDSALFLAALVLMGVVGAFNVAAQLVLQRVVKR